MVIQPTQAKEVTEIPRIQQLDSSASTVKEWLAQIEQQNPAIPGKNQSGEVVQVTSVKANPTDKGVEVILQTSKGEQLQITNRTTGNSFIADIPNAQLRLPSSEAFTFRSQKPIAGIIEITVINVDANTIRVTVTGETSLPVVELFDSADEGLIFSVVSTAPATPPLTLEPSPPNSVTPPEQPTAQDDQAIELVVTGEQDGYQVPETSTATKTDTPLRDIPQSIQIIPRKLLEDRQITQVQQVADIVPGVQAYETYAGIPSASFIIRGFKNTFSAAYRDGFREINDSIPINIAGIERIEFLKGPASVLYGQNEPGGLVNIVSKQPLFQPYYSPSLTIGSFNFYQGALDISGPLNSQKTAAYRLNLAYENAGSFRDFVDSESIFVAPAVSIELGTKTKLTFQFEYQNYNSTFDRNILAEPEGFQVPISRFLGEPGDNYTINYGRASYVLEHQFSENWKLRNGFSAAISSLKSFNIEPFSLQADRRTVDRGAYIGESNTQNYALQTELLGKFQTGAISHQMLLGVELFRSGDKYSFRTATAEPIDLFNPVYGKSNPGEFSPPGGEDRRTDGIGFYLQDQITLLSNLKLLLGGRFDLAWGTSEATGVNGYGSGSTNNSAFSPRAGIVYQPIEPVSLYFSYASAFNPIGGRSARGEVFEPETGEQFETGIKADLIPNRLSTTLAFYKIRKENVLVTDPEDSNFSIQTGEQKSQGIEFNLVGRPVDAWDIALSYAYTDAFVSEDTTIPVGDRLLGVPRHQFGLWNSYQFQSGSLKGWGLGLGLYYVTEAAASLPNTAVDLPSYFRADASIFYKRDNWKFQVNVNNLTNAEIYTSRGFLIGPEPPLTVLGTVSYTF